ncbi:C6 zinc finger protein [Amylocarpus encephaloides]|uniref:C6 zinc finger protein n=1 Tax=Amylocarpus encephaloides TaxID=45428 RepID=A0A9P8C361_9HELO|nr:C6 zinc finger protein [Amylocarpus encephaloides]
MTYTGKPSRGCEPCRKVHVKCDEKHPECSRCVRLKKSCTGYRDEVDIMFRVVDGRSSDSNLSWNGRPRKVEQRSPDLLPGIARSLFPSQEDKSLCYFYEYMIGTMSESDHSWYLHLQLPYLISRTRQDSALYLAAQAISQAVWAKYRGNYAHTMRVSRKRYMQSISALKAAIRDPIEVKSDENLYAVLLLCGYETITFDSEVLSAWGSHVDGAAALLRVRGKEHLSTRFQCNMFLFIRRNAVHSHIQLSRPADPIFDELAEAVISYENTEDRLLSMTIRVPQLQSLASDILSQPSPSVVESDVVELTRAAEDLGGELADWARNVPAGWSYSVATNLNSMSSSEQDTSYYIPSAIHGYADFYIARVWNMYRVSRLIIQSILYRAGSIKVDGQYPEDTQIAKTNRMLVNDICASVPFLLGYDLTQLKRTPINTTQDDKSIWPQSSTSKVASCKHTGRFSLVWPLYLACSEPSIPETQRLWMRAQLRWIAEHGAEKQTKLVSRTQSQTLLGVSEDFRFDCV